MNRDARRNINRERRLILVVSLVTNQSVRHSTPQIRPQKTIGRTVKATQQSTTYLHTYKASTTEQHKAHTHQNASRDLLPQKVLLLRIGQPQLVIQEY